MLVDTSVWIDHFSRSDQVLEGLLNDGEVATHPFVIGEIALGNIPRRRAVLTDLSDLPCAVVASPGELPPFIERHGLFGVGVGYVDAHLLMSAFLTGETRLWSRDRRTVAVARRLGIDAGLN